MLLDVLLKNEVAHLDNAANSTATEVQNELRRSYHLTIETVVDIGSSLIRGDTYHRIEEEWVVVRALQTVAELDSDNLALVSLRVELNLEVILLALLEVDVGQDSHLTLPT